MTIDEAIEFIEVKAALLVQHMIVPEERLLVERYIEGFERMWAGPKLSLRILRMIDVGVLEKNLCAGTSPPAETEIRRILYWRFKRTSLREPTAGPAKRVLRRGYVFDANAYFQVREFLDDPRCVAEMADGDVAKLRALLAGHPESATPSPATSSTNANPPPKRRKPPPPFDYLLEEDEELCPPDTPFDVREAFLREKFRLVRERTCYPADRDSLQQTEYWALHGNRAAQASTAPERAHQLEWSEHEADSFPGYGVSATQHREIELELKGQFGFRRLGPSAQARIARALATNDALDQLNRLVIRRFLEHWPHQTLFSKSDIKRLKVLLTQPSPSHPPTAHEVATPPVVPPDLSSLEVGAVFEVTSDERPVRLIAFDAVEVFYEVQWHDGRWEAEGRRARIIYYRNETWRFLERATKLRVDPPSAEFLAIHRPDLPLRFACTPKVDWLEQPCATRDEFVAYLARTDPMLLEKPNLPTTRIMIVPYTPRGAPRTPVLVSSDQNLSLVDILWRAHQLQRPFKDAKRRGIGFYRKGLESRGVPSFALMHYIPRGSLIYMGVDPALQM